MPDQQLKKRPVQVGGIQEMQTASQPPEPEHLLPVSSALRTGGQAGVQQAAPRPPTAQAVQHLSAAQVFPGTS